MNPDLKLWGMLEDIFDDQPRFAGPPATFILACVANQIDAPIAWNTISELQWQETERDLNTYAEQCERYASTYEFRIRLMEGRHAGWKINSN